MPRCESSSFSRMPEILKFQQLWRLKHSAGNYDFFLSFYRELLSIVIDHDNISTGSAIDEKILYLYPEHQCDVWLSLQEDAAVRADTLDLQSSYPFPASITRIETFALSTRRPATIFPAVPPVRNQNQSISH